MLTRKPSCITDDAKDGNPAFDREGMPSAYAVVPPTTVAGPWHDDGDREACRLVSVNLSAYLDDELDPDQHNLIAEHLEFVRRIAPHCWKRWKRRMRPIQREWRESAPLPSSSQFKQSDRLHHGCAAARPGGQAGICTKASPCAHPLDAIRDRHVRHHVGRRHALVQLSARLFARSKKYPARRPIAASVRITIRRSSSLFRLSLRSRLSLTSPPLSSSPPHHLLCFGASVHATEDPDR